MKKLNDEICLVTGASRGIGRAIAIALGECGATVNGTATTAAGAAAIGDAFRDAGIKGGGHVLDVTSDESVAQLMKSLADGGETPGVLVNNAGITRDNLLLRMKDAEWDEALDANLKSAYRLCKAALRPMTRARHGRIINIASVVAASGNPGQTNYAAAKAGLVGFSKSLAQEVASRNITVNVVAPGFIATDMTAEIQDAQRDALLAKIPLARLGTPQEVAEAVVFLASAAYITGATIHVNGGMWMA